MQTFIITFIVIVAVFTALLNIPILLDINYDNTNEKVPVRIILSYLFFKIRLYPKPKKTKKKNKKIKREMCESGAEKSEENETGSKNIKSNSEKNKAGNDKKEDKTVSFKEFLDNIKTFCEVYKHIKKDLKDIFSYVSKKLIVFKDLRINMGFGFESADKTGIGYGIISGIVYNIMAVIHNSFLINHWTFNLVPDFNNKRFDINIVCILRTRLSYIIIIVWKTVKLYMKYKK